jgi:hypothetical protein
MSRADALEHHDGVRMDELGQFIERARLEKRKVAPRQTLALDDLCRGLVGDERSMRAL